VAVVVLALLPQMDFLVALVAGVTLHQVLAALVLMGKVMLAALEVRVLRVIVLAAEAALVRLGKLPQALLLLALVVLV